MNIFIICPVRGISDNYREGIESQIEFLESQGNKVYYPARDTNQHSSEVQICEFNRKAIKKANLIYVIWDGKSQGVLFDLGMAYAMNKKIKSVIGYMPQASHGKSFQNLIYALEEIK